MLPHQSNEVFNKLETVKKIYWQRKNRNDQGICIRIPHTFSANNTTGPAFTLVLVRYFPATFSSTVSVKGLTVVGYAVPHEHASSRGSFEDFINTFDFQSRTLLVCSGTNCEGYLFPSFKSNPRTRIIRGIGMRS